MLTRAHTIGSCTAPVTACPCKKHYGSCAPDRRPQVCALFSTNPNCTGLAQTTPLVGRLVGSWRKPGRLSLERVARGCTEGAGHGGKLTRRASSARGAGVWMGYISI